MEEENLRTDDDVILDLGGMIDDYLRCVSRYWFQFLLLTLTVAALVLTYFNISYTPSYSARVIYSVNKTGDTTVDAAITTRLSDAITTLTAENEFQEDLLSLVAADTINQQYSFSSSYTSNVNLFSVTVTANNYKNANLILDCFMEVYPAWASRSTGTVDLQEVDISYSYGTATNSYSVTRSVLIEIAIGLVACFAIATIYVLTIQTVRRESDMRKVTTKSCVAMIPEIREKKRSESTRSSLLISTQHVDWGLK
ncbi:MAG: hypothetical protein LUH07_04980, partial [Lachnospiraceae bacterium]|nr:hypothetical protein [Lachnospiraceae bacterium]